MNSSQYLSKAQQLLRAAHQYEQLGDVYHATKLYKAVIKIAPENGFPYQQLSKIYRQRREWKPTLYYSEEAINKKVHDQDIWNNLAMAATALRKWKLAKKALQKVTVNVPVHSFQPIPIRIHTRTKRSEIVWALPLEALCAKIISIPSPESGRRYGEIVLYDWKSKEKQIVSQKTHRVFLEIERFKKSFYRTFSVLIHTDNASSIQKLAELCHNQQLGFENWSNLQHQLATQSENRAAEYYESTQQEQDLGYQLIAIAALEKQEVREVLKVWQLITLQEYSWLDEHE
ncbi:MAG: hypothetical protein AAF806_09625 [Bacteroidota bacterium]